jgi:hypothetical protein
VDDDADQHARRDQNAHQDTASWRRTVSGDL